MELSARDVEILIYTPQELNQSSYFITGLFELESEAKITCRTKISFNVKKGTVLVKGDEIKIEKKGRHLKTSFFKVKKKSVGEEVFFAIDAYDLANVFSEKALSECKYIFKRNYNKGIADILMKKYPANILPLGLTFFVRPNRLHDTWKFFVGFMAGTIIRSIKIERNIIIRLFRACKNGLNEWSVFINTRNIEQYRTFKKPTENKVIFQTRCFPGDSDDTKQVHKDRNNLITTLKAGLGDAFMGGFVPDNISRDKFHDNLTNLPTDNVGYLNLIKSASIGIYTRGIQNSPAWKMAEYLSLAKCIVAEPLTAELPVPLEEGKHIMYFKSPEECVEICRFLLNNSPKMEELSLNAREYYEENVDPAVNAERVIKKVING